MSDETKKPDETTQTQTEEKTFTQSQLDAIIKDRVARTEKKYEDYDSLKSELDDRRKKEKEREDAELSEIDKLKKQNEELLGRNTEAEERIKKFEEAEEQRKADLTERVEKEMEELDDTQKALVNKMPLDERLDLIAQFSKKDPEPGNWGKSTNTGVPTLEDVKEARMKYGEGSDEHKKTWLAYRASRGRRNI